MRARCPQNQYMCAGHPNIVELQDVFMTDKHLAIVMEYAGEMRHLMMIRGCTHILSVRASVAPTNQACEHQLEGFMLEGSCTCKLRPHVCVSHSVLPARQLDAAHDLTADVCFGADGGDLARYTDTLMRFTVSLLHAAGSGSLADVIEYWLPRPPHTHRCRCSWSAGT